MAVKTRSINKKLGLVPSDQVGKILHGTAWYHIKVYLPMYIVDHNNVKHRISSLTWTPLTDSLIFSFCAFFLVE